MDWGTAVVGGLLATYAFSRAGLILTARRRGRRLARVHAASWALAVLAHLAAWRLLAGTPRPEGPVEALGAFALFALMQLAWWVGDRPRERDPGGPGPSL